MRPRVFPAEDDPTDTPHPTNHYASMRPRVFPAEDVFIVINDAYLVELQ